MSESTSLPLPDYERTDAVPRLIVLVGGGLATALALVLVISTWFYTAQYRGRPPSNTRKAEAAFTFGPKTETNIHRDWDAQDAAVRDHLNHYSWVDRSAGVVRIPIDRAMDVLSAEAGRDATAPHDQPRQP